MPAIPRLPVFDSTVPLINDPYRYIATQCQRCESDLFETRLMLQKAICMTGPAAAQLFYDPDRFERGGAMPSPVIKTLLGEGGVQGLDGEAHRLRKQMFMSLMSPARIDDLLKLTAAQWQSEISRWVSMNEVTLYPVFQCMLTRAVCAWAGVPLSAADEKMRTRQLVALFDHAGSAGPRHVWSRLARQQADRWIAKLIEQIRSGAVEVSDESAASVIAAYRDLHGNLLSPDVAAVELLNVIRPTVAVSVYMLFVAHALHMQPELRDRLAQGNEQDQERFIQEVRRYYPFFPAVAARTRQAFEWNGYQFPEGVRVMLDLYGTNQDTRTWEQPQRFDPERFRQWNGSAFNFVPQGGGDHYAGHRCPGEWITIALMKQATESLTRHVSYKVPMQGLDINWSRMPALPRSRVVIADVQYRA